MIHSAFVVSTMRGNIVGVFLDESAADDYVDNLNGKRGPGFCWADEYPVKG